MFLHKKGKTFKTANIFSNLRIKNPNNNLIDIIGTEKLLRISKLGSDVTLCN